MESVQATVMAVFPVGEMLKPVPLLLDAVTVKVTGMVLARVGVDHVVMSHCTSTQEGKNDVQTFLSQVG